MKNVRISLIGAGTASFALGLMRDLCNSEHLRGCTVSLMDIDRERLDNVYSLYKRYVSEIGGELRVEKTLDREESLTGADYVISTALTAPAKRMFEGWAIAEKYGFRFGGSYHIMYDEAFWINFYQFRFMESLTEDMLRICPNAWHLMVSNPVISGTTLLQRKYPASKMIGLCHGYAMAYQLAKDLGYDRDDLQFELSGVNHFVWMKEARVRGEDLFPILDKWILEKGGEYWKNATQISLPLSKKRLDFYRKHGVVGIGDTLSWSGAAWPWWYHTDDETEKEFGEYTPRDIWVSGSEWTREKARKLDELAAHPEMKVTEAFPNLPGNDLMVPMLESLSADVPRVMIVNLLNRGGLVPGLPEDFEVEVPALIDGGGVHPIRTSPLPRDIIAHILRDRVAPVEMELCAYEKGDLDLLVDLVLMDKWATSEKQARAFVKEILDLPYHREMKEHYREHASL